MRCIAELPAMKWLPNKWHYAIGGVFALMIGATDIKTPSGYYMRRSALGPGGGAWVDHWQNVIGGIAIICVGIMLIIDAYKKSDS